MAESVGSSKFVFPKSANYLVPVASILLIGGGLYVTTLVGLGASPSTKDVGYAPTQPVPYSHAVHVGQLGIDCRYCHSTVEKTAFASLPPTQTCMNCHGTEVSDKGLRGGPGIKWDSPRLLKVRQSWTDGTSIPWVKVHDLPDYIFFNHSAHVNKGVGCVECHGRIDRMDVVHQAKSLSMSWCLDCHRDPAPRLRPLDQVTNLGWMPEGDAGRLGADLKKQYGIRDASYLTGCSTCHR